MLFDSHSWPELRSRLQAPGKAVLVTHKNPDGDALGSTLALRHMLMHRLGWEAVVLVPDVAPTFLAYLPGFETVQVFDSNPTAGTQLLTDADLIACLDFNHPSRAGAMESLLNTLCRTKFSFMIDHHQMPEPFVTYMASDTSASSTCEMVYRFIAEMGFGPVLSREESMAIYTGIMTDTGSFRFSATKPETHRITANLLEAGIAHWTIHEHLFNQNTINKLQLWGNAFQHSLTRLPKMRVTRMAVDAETLERFAYEEGDLEGLVNFGLSIKGTVMTALFSERKGKIRISFRSVGAFSVNQFSRNHFGGGGHDNAAGGVFEGSLEAALAHFDASVLAYSELYEVQ
jgi:phosphoesterase RecJ-like protein